MNKLELELDEKKVLADGEYNLDELYGYIDYIAVTEKGLRKEGSFYIEDDPVDDGFGMIAAVELILLRNDWFRRRISSCHRKRQHHSICASSKWQRYSLLERNFSCL